ncbi:hypothetical protein ACQJBY_067710 [Aegilops geniculata]
MMNSFLGPVDGVLGLIMAWLLLLIPAVGFLAAIAVCLWSLCGGERAAEANAPGRRLGRLAELMAAIERAEQMRSAAVAPAPELMVELGYFPYSAEGRRASERLVCAICLEEFQQGQACSEVPACRHVFHRYCIDAWMKSKTTCPLCRRSVVAGSERVSSSAIDMV